MRKIINYFITKLKREQFEIDSRIPIVYLFVFFVNKLLALIWGFILFYRKAPAYIHFTSIVKCRGKIKFQRNLNIDRDCFINALSEDGIKFGKNVSIGKNTTIECTGSMLNIGKGLTVGDNVGLGTNGFWGCAGGVSVGNDCIFGNYVSVHSENHNYEDVNLPIRLQGVSRKGVIIGNNCWVGAKVTFLDGSKVGSGCVIAAGTVVRGEYPENCVIGGVPSKIIKKRC
jgi:Acetyltransferase (isoleucine patch superfamily)